MLKPKNKYLLFILLSIFVSLTVYSQSFFEQTLLPKPTGSYAIGITSLSLTDSSRTEKYTHHKTLRRIQIDIWYPAEKPNNQSFTDYLEGFSSKLIYKIFKSKGIRLSLLDSIKQTPTHSYANATFSNHEREFPVIIFSPGFYFGMAPLYSAFMENLASQGYIVCSISHPYEQPYIQFTDGEEAFMKEKKSQLTYFQLWKAYKLQFRKPTSTENIDKITRNYLRKLRRFDRMLDLWIADTQFFLDFLFDEKKSNHSNNLVQKMDLNQIGTFGQSFGGALAGQLCLLDSRVIAGINLDGFQFGDIIDKPLRKPFMLIQSGYNASWNYGNSAIFANPKEDFYLLDIPNARHLVFSDAALIPDIPLNNRLYMMGNVNGPKTITHLNQIFLEFFDFYLKGKPALMLQKNSPFEGSVLQFYPKPQNTSLHP